MSCVGHFVIADCGKLKYMALEWLQRHHDRTKLCENRPSVSKIETVESQANSMLISEHFIYCSKTLETI
jgi:hypothetical protein